MYMKFLQQSRLPLDIILVIAEFSTQPDLLALAQTYCELRHFCSHIYLKNLGILNTKPATTEVRLVGGSFSGQSMSLLQNLCSRLSDGYPSNVHCH